MSFTESIKIYGGKYNDKQNSRISVDKLLSEYRGRLEISIFICPWAAKRPRNKERHNITKPS